MESRGIQLEQRRTGYQEYKFNTHITSRPDVNHIFILFSRLKEFYAADSHRLQSVTQLPDERFIGYVEYSPLPYSSQNPTINCDSFYPFGSFYDASIIRVKTLGGTGMAELIQQSIAHKLKQLMDNSLKIIHEDPQRNRMIMLDRLGIQKGQRYTIDDYCRLIDEGVDLLFLENDTD